LFYRFDCGCGEHWVAANHDQVLDGPRFADDCPQFDCALNARLPRQWRIDGLHLAEQIGLG
jgi:hypothetical protein